MGSVDFRRSRYAADAAAEEQARLKRERCRKDGVVFGYVAIGFLVLGIGAMIGGGYESYDGKGFKPLEVMGIFAFSATGVLGLWSVKRFLGS